MRRMGAQLLTFPQVFLFDARHNIFCNIIINSGKEVGLRLIHTALETVAQDFAGK